MHQETAGDAAGGRRADGRERILGAARTEFAARGFDGASTAEIARVAGVTQPLVHHHFGSKEDLWKAVVLDVLAELDGFRDVAAAELARTGATDPATRLRVIMRSYVAFVAEHPELARLLAADGGDDGAARLAWLADEAIGRRFVELAALLGTGVAAGDLKPLRPELVGLAFVAAAAYPFQIPGLVARVHGIDVHDPAVVEAHADAVAEIFLHGLLATDAREAARA